MGVGACDTAIDDYNARDSAVPLILSPYIMYFPPEAGAVDPSAFYLTGAFPGSLVFDRFIRLVDELDCYIPALALLVVAML